MSTRSIQVDDWAWDVLDAEANRIGANVSELLTDWIAEKTQRGAENRLETFRNWQPPWKDRDDIGDSSEYVRAMRTDDRLDRLNAQ